MRRHRPGPQGDSGEPDFSPRRPRGRPLGPTPGQRRGQRIAWGVAVLLAAVLLGGLWMARDPLGAQIFQGTERARLLDQAEVALRAGELSRPDGRGARELYLAVLALDPDHQVARQGLADTGRAALAQAEHASLQGEEGRADAMLQLARELHVPGHELERVQALRTPRGEDLVADEVDLGNLLARIQNIRRGRSAEDALPRLLPLYSEALALAPGHLLVLTSRSRLLDDVLEEAGRDIDAGQLEAAQDKVDRVAQVDAAHAGLPGLRGRLIQARQALAARAPGETPAPRVEDEPVAVAPAAPAADVLPVAPAAPGLPEAERVAMLARFDEALARQALLDPPGDSAWDRLRVLRSGASQDPRVIDAEQRFRARARGCFEQHVVTPRLSSAENCLQALETVDPGDAGIADASRRLAARWIGMAQERLGAARIDDATRAYEAALARDPTHPELASLAARLEQARPR